MDDSIKDLRQYGVHLARSVNARLNTAAKATGTSRGNLFRSILDPANSTEVLSAEDNASRGQFVFRTFNVHPEVWGLHSEIADHHNRSFNEYLSALVDTSLKKMGY